MKRITIDFDLYAKELDEQHHKGFSESFRLLLCFLKERHYMSRSLFEQYLDENNLEELYKELDKVFPVNPSFNSDDIPF